jgi:Putative Actinobacterial Holin-X, holin superfamily III
VSEPHPPPGEAPASGRPAEHPQNIATAITDISERATLLVREEIELAKAEISEKAVKLAKGAVVGVAAGIFFVMALIFVLVGCAWLLYYYLPGNDFTYFWGFFAMAVILVVLGALAGLIAARVVKRGAPPTPDMAIEEARLIRETISSHPASPPPAGRQQAGDGSQPPPVAPPVPPPTQPPVPAAPGGEG